MTDVYCYKMKNERYPDAPFHPGCSFPELKRLPYEVEIDLQNEVYSAVREILRNLDLDKENCGTEEWNPFGKYISEGMKVLIKPNMVFHEHPYGDEYMQGMITHASVLRPIIDYVLLATKGKCEIIIGDCPVQSADFNKVKKVSGIADLVEFYSKQGIDISVRDMRKIISEKNSDGVLVHTEKNPNRSSNEYVLVDLKEKSELIDVIDRAHRFEITDYRYGDVAKHHNSLCNEYMIPKEVLEADFIINIPKLKTHRKAGITCAMKNMVGVNGDKTCIAHHTRGFQASGGDEFNHKKIKKMVEVRVWNWLKSFKLGIWIATKVKRFYKRTIWHGKNMKEFYMENMQTDVSEGNWYGNDTIWRCVKDINKIVLYSDKQGNMKNTVQRNYLCIVDAVIAGEGEGPMEQTNKPFCVVFGGENPVFVDYTAAKLMKFSYKAIPLILNGFNNRWWGLASKTAENVVIDGNMELDKICVFFKPSSGWSEKLVEE